MSQHDTLTLEPCPFCGAQPEQCDVGDHVVTCPSCGVDGPYGAPSGVAGAIQGWNRRAALSATQPAAVAQGAGEVGEYLANVDEFGGVRWFGCPPPHGTKLYTQPAAGADVLDAVSPVGDWSYSHDEERFSGQFDTKEAAIAEGLSCGARFVGQVNHVRDIISDGQIGWDIYERIGEILGDEIGEVAERFTLSPDQQEVLGKVVLDWIESGPGFNCWGIKDVEPIDAAIAASGRKS